MVFKKVLLLIVILLLTGTILNAGTAGKLAGFITEKTNGEPIPGVNIIIIGTDRGAPTELDGNFIILNIPPGIYEVQISAIGYKKLTVKDVRVQIDKTTDLSYSMEHEVLQGEVVTVIAKKPKVELDLTASKQTVTDRDIADAWGTDIQEVIADLPGVNINGGIRGGFGLDVAYHLDGMDMRDASSNTNFTGINLTTIKELEVLTGGWNAEYGQANGAIINVVTKSSLDRIHGTASYRMRPAGKYHWGDNIYSEDGFMKTVMTTPNFWNPDSTWTTEWIEADTTKGPHAGYNGGTTYFKNMSSEERAEWWTKFVNDEKTHPQMNYTDLVQREVEATIYGPITKKLGFMLSGRYKKGINIYPSALLYNPDYTLQASLSYSLTSKTTIDATAVYTSFENSGSPKTNYSSTEDTYHYNSFMPFVTDPYSRWMFWMYGANSSSEWNIRAPEYATMFNSQIKLTHMFSDKTFAEFIIQRSSVDYEMHYRDIMRTAYYDDLGFSDTVAVYTEIPSTITTLKWGDPGDFWSNKVRTDNTMLKFDLSSQITPNHLIKTGGLFSYLMIDKVLHDCQSSGDIYFGHVTDLAETMSHPYEGAFYIQDKIEFLEMIMNAGIRIDFFNANKNISANAFDPLMLSDSTEGHTGEIGHVSWDPDGKGPGYVNTPTQVAISPRLGISHPLTENTVLHFMYGKFNQRPAWQKISSPTVVRTTQLPTAEQGGTSEMKLDPDSTLAYYNFYTHMVPNHALTYEKMTQYEVGFEQNVADLFSFDITMYYKEAHDLTSRGMNQGKSEFNISSSSGPVRVEMHGDPNSYDGRDFGRYIGYFNTFVNGAWAEVKGVEATVESKFRYFNFKLNYTASYLITGENHYSTMVKVWEDGSQLGRDVYEGAGNSDNGYNGSEDDTWNPKNSATLRLFLNSPEKFGPTLMGFNPFGGIRLSSTTTWSEGQRYTYYPLDYEGYQTPNNKVWKSRWNTNLNLTKSFQIWSDLKGLVGMSVTNLFNQKHLRLPAESNREEYFEYGKLPVDNTTLEPLVWNYYYNRPRMTNFYIELDF